MFLHDIWNPELRGGNATNSTFHWTEPIESKVLYPFPHKKISYWVEDWYTVFNPCSMRG